MGARLSKIQRLELAPEGLDDERQQGRHMTFCVNLFLGRNMFNTVHVFLNV